MCARLFRLVRCRERIVTRREFIALISSTAAIRPLDARAERPPERVLYFTYSAGYRHDVIPLSEAILTQLGRNSSAFEVIATEDLSEFSAGNLERYAAVMFYTTGEIPMSGVQKAALLNFVHSGRGFLGVHSATDTFYGWPDYLDLIGGYFNGHPWHQGVTVEVADAADPVVAFLGNSLLQLNDEIYQISDFDYRGSHVLLRLDQSSVDLSKTGVHQRFYGWPLAWKRFFGEGRDSIRRSATRHQSGKTRATRESSRTLSSGLREGQPRSRCSCAPLHSITSSARAGMRHRSRHRDRLGDYFSLCHHSSQS
jgi:type 1 glutamine amidotransferase